MTTPCIVCNQEIEVSVESFSAHADWHVNGAVFIWLGLWFGFPIQISTVQVPSVFDWAVDENWVI